ncbi:MAG: hypothetical protein HYS04_05035 [Acidobacteria bacterium]|nr:hypothetical protein [Acidobacteriota bacterium]
MKTALAVLVVGAASLHAQSSIEGPSLGYIYDAKAGAARPVRGLLGAAVIGEPLASDSPLRKALVSPAHNYLLGVAGDDAAVALVLTNSGELRVLEAARPAPDRIALSPGGGAAALVYGEAVQIFTGLPEAPEVARELALAAAPAALAVSDDGSLLLAVTREDESVVVSILEDGVETRLITSAGAGSVRFLRSSRDALIADTAGNRVLLLRDASELVTLANLDQPSAAAASPDGRRIVVASAASRTLAALDPNGEILYSAECDCTPALLEPLAGGALFRLTDPAEGPAWVFDASGPEPRLAFLPGLGASDE